jgi:hypothetical protein
VDAGGRLSTFVSAMAISSCSGGSRGQISTDILRKDCVRVVCVVCRHPMCVVVA